MINRLKDFILKDSQSAVVTENEVATVPINPRTVLISLVLLSGVFSALGASSVVAHAFWPESSIIHVLAELFNLNGEANAPSWYSSLLWMLAAVIAAVIALDHKMTSRGLALQWFGFSLVCAFLSVDEAAMIHEKIGDVLALFFDANPHLHHDGNFIYAWVYWGVAFLAGFVVLYWRFLLALPKRVFLQIVISGVVFVSGAIIFETFSTWVDHGKFNIDFPGDVTLFITVEETLEMLGVVLLIHALLTYKRLRGIHTKFVVSGRI